jgi:branched-chain amino acid transport system permease protein
MSARGAVDLGEAVLEGRDTTDDPTAATAVPAAALLHADRIDWFWSWPTGLAVLALFCAAPLMLGDYALHAVIISMIFLLPGLGLNLIVGYAGMLSLAQGAFFGIGAYASALLAAHFGTPFYVNLVAAALVAGAIALPLGVPALRLKTYSFVMCTLGFVIIGQAVAKNWVSLTRGDMGLSGLPNPYFALGPLSFSVTSVVGNYYLALAVAVIATLVFAALVSSAAGRAMVAIRDDETLALSLGVPTWSYKLVVFVLSAMFAGVGGSLYAHYLTVVSPLSFDMYYTTMILIIVLGGGAGTIRGTILGSVVFVALSEALRIAPELRMIIYGFVLLALVFAFPQGLVPLLDRGLALVLPRRAPSSRSAES